MFHGFYIYPYWDVILSGPADQIEKLPKVLTFLHQHGLMVTYKALTQIWITLRSVKSVLFELFYFFFFSYLVYCWYKDNPNNGVKILKTSINCIVWIICFYSLFELAYFLGFDFGKQFLVTVNPLLHPIGVSFNWWPPLLWEGRIRSIFPEPSQFGMYATFSIPFLLSNIMSGEKLKTNIIQFLLLTALIFLSLSKTACVLYIFEIVLFSAFIVIRGIKPDYKKYF